MERLVKLNNGLVMPRLGLGLYKAGAGDLERAMSSAVTMGYRLFDTASAYKNEEFVGKGVAQCGVPRDELFITTKIWNNAQRIGNVMGAFERSLERLDLEYVDLYLVHWPVPGCYLNTWKVMEEIYRSGRAKAIGVSNFDEYQLTDLLEHCEIPPAVNQIEYHPLFSQDGIREFCQKNGIVVQAYAPLARGAYAERAVMQRIAEKYNRSTAQVGLRWILQKGCCVIPKTVRDERLLENSQIFDFELDETEVATIDSLNENYRSSSIPADLLV
ncbi:MAG: aldo/keto reductase [Lachnospiraceae bacterium]|nr:aldo/keto reductase [Lachnospiraceae bacterium]